MCVYKVWINDTQISVITSFTCGWWTHVKKRPCFNCLVIKAILTLLTPTSIDSLLIPYTSLWSLCLLCVVNIVWIHRRERLHSRGARQWSLDIGSPQETMGYIMTVQCYNWHPKTLYDPVSNLQQLQCYCDHLPLQQTTGMLQRAQLSSPPSHPNRSCSAQVFSPCLLEAAAILGALTIPSKNGGCFQSFLKWLAGCNSIGHWEAAKFSCLLPGFGKPALE